MPFTDNPILVYLIAGGLAILMGLIAAVGYFAVQRNSQSNAFDAQMADLLADNFGETKTQVTLITRWNRYWGELAKSAGIARYNDEESTAGRDVVIAGVVIAVVVSVLLRNIIIGPVAAVALIYVINSVLRMQLNKEQERISAQLPGFLFALKANIQAHETPERAIIKIVDTMPKPLHNDLMIVKNKLLANATFKDALEEMSRATPSRDLKFLCACMIQATTSGADMENQITVIQKILEARSKVADELNSAVRSATPAMWISSIVIPGVFVVTMMSDPTSRDFWFTTPLSWVAFGAIIALWAAGMWMSKKLVDSIKNL